MKQLDKIKEVIKILKQKKQIILQGAPGTGKTYTTSEIAVNMINSDAPADRETLMIEYQKLVEQNRIFFTTFHQSMDYEEFIEGYKPDGSGGFVLKNGIFKEACRTAKNVVSGSRIEEGELEPVILIIDEINRANISKVFGELITLLEADKRIGSTNEIKCSLPYSEENFSVPPNLYIIGTMNTADRTIGYIDYALRRRFAFITLEAEREKCSDNIAKGLFDAVKNIIEENISIEFEINDIMIGHSYFIVKDVDELKIKLEYEIKPLLLEYLKDGILIDKEGLKDNIKTLSI